MKPLQTMNSAASFAIFSALIAGLVRMFDANDDIEWSALPMRAEGLLLAIFIVLFRTKMHFDDHRHFGESDIDANHLKYAGVVLAILIWICMAVSAGTVDRPKVAATFLLFTFLISTLWIITHVAQLTEASASEPKATLESRLSWARFNVIYLVLLTAYITAGSFGTGLFSGKSALIHVVIVVLMISVLFVEKIRGKTYIRFLGG